MNQVFPKMKKNLGFGGMRLPMKGDKVDIEQFSAMVDAFLAGGFNYFDTAHGYLGGESEIALRQCLTSRYPREAYVLANKLSGNYFKCQADIRPVFESQLEACGVDYFDIYLMHAQCAEYYTHYKKCMAYETALELLAEGKIKHFGISFHDTADVLERILTEYPQIEIVQIQFNYADYDDPAVESRKVYEVCERFGKPVIVMEPIKGGTLINLPDEAKAVLAQLHGGSPASYAIRFAASFRNIRMVLSGMSNVEQVRENMGFMNAFTPLNDTEHAVIRKVCDLFHAQKLIPCTACHYCTDGCPMRIRIPELFACMNAKNGDNDWNQDYYYDMVLTGEGKGGKAGACIQCGKCEHACPQHLPIRKLMKDVAATFEKN